MGRLTYSNNSQFNLDDRVLAHLRVVIMNKLRRNEPFMLQLPHESTGHISIWIHAAGPLAMQFYGGRHPRIEQDLIEKMMAEASGPDGLTLRYTH